MKKLMKAVEIEGIGGPEKLKIKEVHVPTPSSEEILVKVAAAGINRCDVMQRKGEYKIPKSNHPRPGIEVAGIISDLGEKVSGFRKGDTIFGYVNGGGYAEYCLMDQGFAIPIPKNWEFVQAAAVAEVFQTANEVLFTHGNLQPEETVLLHSGASGVGTAAIQLAKFIKSTVIVTTGNVEKEVFCKSLGADLVINYKNENFVQKVKEFVQNGVDLLIDTIGSSFFKENLHALAEEGRMIAIGLLGGSKCQLDLSHFIEKRLVLKGHNTRGRTLFEQRKITKRFKEKWMPHLENSTIVPIVDKVYAFDDVQKAHQYMEENKNMGKIVLKIF